MKKRTLLLTTLAVLTITFLGCGSSPQNSTTTIPNNTSVNQTKDASSENNNDAQTDSSIISQEEASKIVLSKVDGATEQNLRISLDTDDGQQIYEGEIRYNGMEYEFELNAKTGDVLEWSNEREND